MAYDVLCTAEDFGFGPAAALHRLLPYLKNYALTADYAGSGITLDLHRDAGYASVYDADVRSASGRDRWKGLLRRHSRVFSVCDIRAAEVACEAGADVVLYDILAWFRRPLPDVYKSVGLLVCPDFFGLRARLNEPHFARALVVPPLIPAALPVSPAHRQEVLINLGGLHTPFTSDAECAAYAQLMVDVVAEATGVVRPGVLVSQQIGALLQRCAVHTVTPAEARQWLSSCDVAFMTSGLGNIFDAAGQGACVCFLPPMSDSQGQQAIALRERRLIPLAVDWHDMTDDGQPINYWAPKKETVPAMLRALRSVMRNQRARRRFVDLLRAFVERPNHAAMGATLQQEFKNQFGCDDGSQAAAAVATHFGAYP